MTYNPNAIEVNSVTLKCKLDAAMQRPLTMYQSELL